MQKIDFKKELKHLYQISAKQVVQVEVPAMNFLMIDGHGDPNTATAYSTAVEALFAVSYAIKFIIKKSSLALDYAVMPLEGLWWTDNMSEFTTEDKSNWQWTMMIMQPEFITAEIIHSAIGNVKKKKNLPAISKLRSEWYAEGKCAQILHIGPFSEEGPTIGRVHEFIDSRSRRRGKHHEIYLSDIRKANPARWKTIIRQPMQ